MTDFISGVGGGGGGSILRNDMRLFYRTFTYVLNRAMGP